MVYERERYAEPASYAELGLEGEGARERAIRAAKKFLPLFVLLVVVAGAGYFFYDMLIGSIRTVTFTVKNSEGEELNDARIKIFSASGEEVFVGAGRAVHTTELRKGTYNADVTATGYELKREQITVSDKPSMLIELEKNIRAEIVNPKNSFPASLVGGQALQAQLAVENKGKTAIEAVFVFEGDMKKFGINVLPTPLIVPPESTSTALLEIRVPREIEIKDRAGNILKGSVRIKFTKKKYELETRLYPAPNIELKEIDFGRLKAGAGGIDKDTGIINKSNFPVTGLKLGIEITSAALNKPSEVIKWFKFTEIAGSESPTVINIPLIEKSGRIEKKLRVDVPLTAKKEVISGNLILSASFLTQEIKTPLTLEVSEETNISLTARPRPNKINIEWITTQGKYEEKSLVVEFTNTGSLPLKNTQLSVKNPATCHPGWLRIAEQAISELNPRQSRDLTLFASAPVSQRGNENRMDCKLRYRYDNPTPTGPTFFDGEIEGFVTITPQPE